jgi:hypothetical protein
VRGGIGGGQAHTALSFPIAVCFDRPECAVGFDVLDDPLLPVGHPETGVVLAGLDHIAPPDRETVATGRGRLVIHDSGADALVADVRVQPCGFVVGGDRDRLPIVPVLGDVVLQRVGIGVQVDQAERGELVEDLAGLLPVAQPHREVGVGGVGEAVDFGHVDGASANGCGHVEQPATTDRWELRTVADERDGCARICGNGE